MDGFNATPVNEPIDIFAFKIDYNLIEHDFGGEVRPLYNGNIAQTSWKSDSDNIVRSYGYKYDDLNRLKKGIYERNSIVTHSYDETLDYDKNGNIIKLKPNGYYDNVNTGTAFPIDELYYGYDGNSNKLLYVHDQTNSTEGFKDGNMFGNDYEYDDYGNMTQDNNKNIGKIFYNHLNLPVKIEFNTGGQNVIEYLYNAVGLKISKTVTSTTPQTGTELNKTVYLSGFQYKNNVLQFFPTAEGYVSVTDESRFDYVYNYLDHLGNVRLSYTLEEGQEELKILEENHYYPFGLKHSYNTNRRSYSKSDSGAGSVTRPVARSNYQYKYNGKEYQDELGLNVTAMDFRQYDNAIGRFLGMDRLAEMSHNLTPYRFGFNNPVFWSDPSGLFENNNGDLAHCPTCPNTPEFQPLIDDPNNEYFYDPETNSASQVIQLDEVVVTANESSDLGNAMSTAMWSVNTGVGFASLGVGYQGQFHRMNEAYHITKTAGTSYFWQDKWKNPGAKYHRAQQVAKVQGTRNLATKLTKVGGVLLVGDIALSGEIKPSHVINGLMLGASMTGVGSIVAGVWFIADFGTMGVNYLINGEAKGIGDMIDESDWGKSKTVKMYDGLY